MTGEKGRAAGAFIYRNDVAVDRKGTLYVADGYASAIQIFDATGEQGQRPGPV